MKTCAVCKSEKPFSEFHRRKDRDGYASKCKCCKAIAAADYRARNLEAARSRSLAWHEQNRERSISTTRRWQRENSQRQQERLRAWRKGNRERVAQVFKAWADANKPAIRAIKARRRAAEVNALVPWSDPAEIFAIYATAQSTTEQTGEAHEVDHIVPLVSPYVCGLHVHHNLRIIPKLHNCSKGNRWWPEMPDLEAIGGN